MRKTGRLSAHIASSYGICMAIRIFVKIGDPRGHVEKILRCVTRYKQVVVYIRGPAICRPALGTNDWRNGLVNDTMRTMTVPAGGHNFTHKTYRLDLFYTVVVTASLLHDPNFKITKFKHRKLPVRQSKHRGSCVGRSCATTSCLLGEGRLHTNRRSVVHISDLTLHQSRQKERRRTTT